MTHTSRLLVVNHTATAVDADDLEQRIQERTGFEVVGGDWDNLERVQKRFDILVLMGLGDRPEKGYKMIKTLRGRWPQATLHVITKDTRKMVADHCHTLGVTKLFHPFSDRENLLLELKKPPGP